MSHWCHLEEIDAGITVLIAVTMNMRTGKEKNVNEKQMSENEAPPGHDERWRVRHPGCDRVVHGTVGSPQRRKSLLLGSSSHNIGGSVLPSWHEDGGLRVEDVLGVHEARLMHLEEGSICDMFDTQDFGVMVHEMSLDHDSIFFEDIHDDIIFDTFWDEQPIYGGCLPPEETIQPRVWSNEEDQSGQQAVKESRGISNKRPHACTMAVEDVLSHEIIFTSHYGCGEASRQIENMPHSDSETYWSSFPVMTLRSRLRSLGLSQKGKKVELVARIIDHVQRNKSVETSDSQAGTEKDQETQKDGKSSKNRGKSSSGNTKRNRSPTPPPPPSGGTGHRTVSKGANRSVQAPRRRSDRRNNTKYQSSRCHTRRRSMGHASKRPGKENTSGAVIKKNVNFPNYFRRHTSKTTGENSQQVCLHVSVQPFRTLTPLESPNKLISSTTSGLDLIANLPVSTRNCIAGHVSFPCDIIEC